VAGDTNRLAHGEGSVGRTQVDGSAVEFVGRPSIIFKQAGRAGNVALRLRKRFAAVDDLQH
jgi:hypothetical protein